jgi:hypothetical protein
MMLHNKERIHSCIKKKKKEFYLQTMKVSHLMQRKGVVTPFSQITYLRCLKELIARLYSMGQYCD